MRNSVGRTSIDRTESYVGKTTTTRTRLYDDIIESAARAIDPNQPAMTRAGSAMWARDRAAQLAAEVAGVQFRADTQTPDFASEAWMVSAAWTYVGHAFDSLWAEVVEKGGDEHV